MVLATLFAVGIRHPIGLAGSGIVTMTGFGALLMPGPIMVLGFILASGGVLAGVMMLKR